jgi:hypothetical protein
MGNFFASHRGLVWGGGGVLLAGVIFVTIWFQPQKLIIENEVIEASPTSSATAPSPTQRGSSVIAQGSFQSLEHETSGRARVLELADGSRFLRFEDLETSNGPDLRVYLSEIPASNDWHAYGERFLDLGALKGNRGDQNYEIPPGADLSRFKSAVIWCRRFTVGFGVAGFH